MTYLFDFDYTLLDTDKWNRQLAVLLDLDFAIFKEYDEKFFRSQGKHFNPYKLSSNLVNKRVLSQSYLENFRTSVNELLQEIDNFLIPEANPVLKRLKASGHKLVLVTLGDPVWQEAKLAHASIRHYFDKVIFTDKPKEKAVEFLKDEPLVIVNDNAKESLRMKEVLPQAELVLVDGPYSRNIDHGLPISRINDIISKKS